MGRSQRPNCLSIHNVLSMWAGFWPCVTFWLFAKQAVECAVTFAWHAMFAQATIVVCFEFMVPSTFGTPDLTHQNRALFGKVFHWVAVWTLDYDCLFSAMYKLDLVPKHAHSLKCCMLGNHLIFLNVGEWDWGHQRRKIGRVPYPAQGNQDENGLEAGVGGECLHEVFVVESDFCYLVPVRNLLQVCPCPSVCWDQCGSAFEWAT